MKKSSMTILAVMLLGAVALGCSENKAATEACKDATDCAACCSKNGASGNDSTRVGNKTTCKCLGG